MEQCIRQNNAVDIYEDYFETVDDSTQCEKPEAKTVHVFRDPTATQYKRPVSAVSWCPDGGTKIAIAYCNLEFQATHPDTTKESYCFKVGELLSHHIHAIHCTVGLPKFFRVSCFKLQTGNWPKT